MVAVLLGNVRSEQKGKPRRRLEGRVLYSSSDAVGLVLRCPDSVDPDQRIVDLARTRVIWVRRLLRLTI